MRIRPALPVALALAVSAVPSLAAAQPALRVQVTQRGDFALIGNTLAHDCGAGVPAPVVGTVGACGTNTADTAPDVSWRADSPLAGQAEASIAITATQARSTAVLSLPPGATITHAYLYWAANAPTPDTTAVLDRPGAFTQSVVALQSSSATLGPAAYQSVADVTGVVQANGSGAYRVGDVTSSALANVNGATVFTAWWMVVLYELPSEPMRSLAVYDGLGLVIDGTPQDIALSGFEVPPAFGAARLGVVAFDGDDASTGDTLSFGGAALSDALNPSDNFFDGTRSRLGVPVSVAGDLPQLTGTPRSMSGVDLDVVDVTARLGAGQTSASVSASSVGDSYLLAGLVASIPTSAPDLTTSTKSFVDLGGGSAVLPGDEIEYSITVANSGTGASASTILRDPLPAGLSYVPGSLRIASGANAGDKTDASGDDQGEYDAASRTIVVRLGSGATGAQGGSLATGGSTTVAFRVRVDAGTLGVVSNQATITAAGQLGAPAVDTPSDGNGPAEGAPPTTFVVGACETDAMCAAPSPRCDTEAAPAACVECLADEDCSGLVNACSSRSCVCVAGVGESCNGDDDDCDGVIDEGFDVGDACTAGVGACTGLGVVVCDGEGNSTCDATAGEPGDETCGDRVDGDCDDAIDEGCEVGDDGGATGDDGGATADAGAATRDGGGSSADAGATPEEDEGGCSCRAAGTGTRAPWGALATAGLALALVARRRSRASKGERAT